MKSILRILVLGVVPILAATAVVDQGLAADKGSQLIFQSNMAHQNYISVANANDGRAVTVLVQYYNDEMTVVLYFLRVIPGGGNVLVDPFDHEIPGTATNVSDVLDGLPALTQTTGDKLPGINSGRFLIVVTAVGANVGVDANEDGKIADVVAVDADAEDDTTTAVGGYRIRNGEVALIRKQTPSGENPTIEWDQPYADDDSETAAAFVFSAETNRAKTVNVLFPKFLAEDMHGIDNIDNGGTLSLAGAGLALTNKDQRLTASEEEIKDGVAAHDASTKNVGDLEVGNAVPIAFNHLTGHFTEALSSTASGGSDQTASWGGTPIVRPAVSDTANGMKTFSDAAEDDATAARMFFMMGDYYTLNGMDSMPVVNHVDRGWLSLTAYEGIVTDPDATPPTLITPLINAPATDTLVTDFDNSAVRGFTSGRLAEKDAGGGEVLADTNKDGMVDAMDSETITNATVTSPLTRPAGYESPSKIAAGSAIRNRGLNGGALVLPALYGVGAETKQIMLLLSAADDFGGAGSYKLMGALTKYTVTVHDNMGNVLPNPADDRVFGGSGGPEIKGTSIIVEGIRVITDAAACGGDPEKPENMLEGYWTVDNLISDIPTASSGAKDFAGLDAMLDPMQNATPGFIKFMRAALTCTEDHGDGDIAGGQGGDGVPPVDKRTYTGGTLIVEEKNTDRAFVTTGQALLKFLTSDATFAASWSLKSPPGPAN